MANPPFPVENSTTPFWRAGELHHIDDFRSPSFPSEVDVVIIGAGYAGASIAYHMLENPGYKVKSPSILILEARQACAGATGRNGGHLKPDPFNRPGNALSAHGKEAAEAVASFEARHVKAIADVVKREGIDCDLVLTRAIDVWLYDKGRDVLKDKVDRLTDAGVSTMDDVFYGPPNIAEAFSGVKGAKGCFSSTAGHLWPYKLVSSLLKIVVAKGVNLQTNTPVTAVSDQQNATGRWTVSTERGNVAANKVVFASNGYTSGLIPEFKDRIVPVRGICSRIVSPKPRPPLLTNTYVMTFSDWEYDYLIPRTDGSIVVGGARRDYYHQLDSWFDVHDDSKYMESAKHYFDGYMQRHFHGWEDSEAYTESVWTGIMGYTTDAYPFVGELPGKSGQYVCAGFNGHGMVMAFLSGKAVADMLVEEKKVEEVDLPQLYRCTPERLASQKQHYSLTAFDAYQRSADAKL